MVFDVDSLIENSFRTRPSWPTSSSEASAKAEIASAPEDGRKEFRHVASVRDGRGFNTKGGLEEINH